MLSEREFYDTVVYNAVDALLECYIGMYSALYFRDYTVDEELINFLAERKVEKQLGITDWELDAGRCGTYMYDMYCQHGAKDGSDPEHTAKFNH